MSDVFQADVFGTEEGCDTLVAGRAEIESDLAKGEC